MQSKFGLNELRKIVLSGTVCDTGFHKTVTTFMDCM